MATEPKKTSKPHFEPVTLYRNGEEALADTATRLVELRFEGWRTAKPSAEKPKPSAPKP